MSMSFLPRTLASAALLTLLAGCGGPSGTPVAEPSEAVASPASARPKAPKTPAEKPTPRRTKAARTPKATATAKPKPTRTTPPVKPVPPNATPRPKPSTTPPKPRPKPSNTAQPPAPSAGRMNATEERVFVLTNQERAKAGCPALRREPKLVIAARGHSTDMAVNDYFSHTSQDGSSPWDRIKRTGYTGGAAENIAAGYSSPEAVMDGWMKSPGHRANILNCDLKALGVGWYRNYWTQNFGRS